MTREEFRNKYHGQVISIPKTDVNRGIVNIQKIDQELRNLKSLLSCCEEIGLSSTKIQLPIENYRFYTLIDKEQEIKEVLESQIPTEFFYFITDFSLYLKDKEFKKEEEVKNMLNLYGLTSETVKSCVASISYLIDNGYIQGETTNKTSLWWNANGERIFFICGVGTFRLSNITY